MNKISQIQDDVRDWSLQNFPPHDVGGAVPESTVKEFMRVIKYVGQSSHSLLKAEQEIRGGFHKLKEISAPMAIECYTRFYGQIEKINGQYIHSNEVDITGYDVDTPEWTHKLLGIIEECGELVEAIMNDDEAEIRDALGDIFIFLCDLSSSLDVDLGDAIDETLDEVLERDWSDGEAA